MAKQNRRLVFLSYSTKDTKAAESLYNLLEQNGFRPWMFSRDVLPGEIMAVSMEKALRSADFCLLLLSPSYFESDWNARESELALELAAQKQGIFLLPVRLQPVVPPPALAQYRWIDFFKPEGFEQLLNALTGSRAYTLPPPEVPSQLVEACLSGNCVLYAGAGIAAGAGFPTWKPFVEDLVNWAVNKDYVDTHYSQSLMATLQQGQLDSVADSIVNIVKDRKAEKDLRNFLRRTFVKPPIETQEVHRLLGTISFSAALTTNFDVVLENIFSERKPTVFTPQDAEALLTAYSKNEFFILKLYGAVDKPETLLISRPEFEDAITQNFAFTQFMETLFFNRTIFFLGASISGIETYLEGIRFKSGSKNHYALVEVYDDTYRVDADRLARRYGIQVIPFTTQSDYTEVRGFVKVLSDKILKRRSAIPKSTLAAEESKIRPTSFLKRINLENIGPFDSLSLELNQAWNILLGDNGVGKSSILKAIALGIAGEDAQLYADRLIKTGRTHATITLETDTGKTYLTEILKTSGPARVVARGGRLLEGEGWLTLGFPPLRTMGWEQLHGPQLEEGKRRPVPGDVLPLVMGDPDPRCNRLKQWILNLDYRSAKNAQNVVDDSVQYQNMMRQFFGIVSDLAEGVKIEFKQVDLDKGKIMILTDDGEVPIEALSQGTISLIGWVGVLLQRMYEVMERAHDVQKQYALVLIDEIDAHMHPAWQQKLVRHLKNIFPMVQFIVTTHSPLVTLASEPGETLLVQRVGPNRSQVVVERSELDVRRWRADQVLTTLFGLESSNPALYAWIKEYTDLLSQDSLDEQQNKRLNYLAGMLEISPPEPFEREEARLAFQSIEMALDEQIAKVPKEKQEAIRREAKVQILESITRQRRPL